MYKIIVLIVAIVTCIAINIYIQSYNKKHSSDLQGQFHQTVEDAKKTANQALQQAKEQKDKAVDVLQKKKEEILRKKDDLLGNH